MQQPRYQLVGSFAQLLCSSLYQQQANFEHLKFYLFIKWVNTYVHKNTYKSTIKNVCIDNKMSKSMTSM